ncbi:MAG TPA: ABC transporter permease [Candidatus Dormibacteraeota bacterium]|nr:ABC transporter permease [Candidatus Dormibacteraeota bacterium]
MTAALRVLEYDARVYRRTWRGGLVLTIVGPILFLASMGFGLGRFVDQGGHAGGLHGGVPYAAWLAPGLLAAQAMQTAGFQSTYPIMGRIVWDKIYHGMLATPITVPGIVFGEIAWTAVRLGIGSAAFLAVMAVFGLVSFPLGLLALPAAVLTGLAFAVPIFAFTATQRNDQGFNAIFRFGLTPLFLFSGTFFPVDQLPLVVRPIAWVTPLWHGVDLLRSMTLGRVDPALAAVHVVVLTAFVAAGAAAALVTFRRALVR